ncbi:multicopper oxidase domain-containing protein [Bifidobacterium sp. W8101]|uniref:multicopper oxidase domain-containing protein n=1 Tax=Bifidobacterium TaxID=1678 RepID=UPI0018DDC4F6|nr:MULTISPECIES: multicopper oxidase domain-containing protein [Bifidobacterium]MBI0126686.1 multicopper oxidase domain-containing protein [Bifidobacterium choladohabitans]MBI0128255.1 multicopper oxidase domain-containing protein [Bifidobacterium sp. W8103]MBI0138842.1 multicopper oxidase domain-containing protein [Bifidobacterium sp. W8105]MBI0148188.1 multicopper oxidase domain-containing protein [Bifidobacterium sp. W8107]
MHNDPKMRKSGGRTALPRSRMALLLGAGLAALLGLVAALIRADLIHPSGRVPLADLHGGLMVYGFLGAAIGLERAVAYRSGGSGKPAWGFLAPALGLLGSLLCLLSLLASSCGAAPAWVKVELIGGIPWTLSMLVLTAIYSAIWRRQPSAEVIIQVLGSLVGLVGAAGWVAGLDAAVLAPTWLFFLVLTIVGERVELARAVFSDVRLESGILGLSLLAVLMLPVQAMAPSVGYPLLGLSLGLLLLVMASHDVAKGTFRHGGLPGFMGTCMLSAYAWGLLAALIWMVAPLDSSTYWGDMALHALAVGFIMTMVIAHVCMIVPSVIRRPLPFHPLLWGAWALMQVGLLIRLLGAIRLYTPLWKAGNLLNVLGILSMMLTVVYLAARGKQVLASKRYRRRQPEGSQAEHVGTLALRMDLIATSATVLVLVAAVVLMALRPTLAVSVGAAPTGGVQEASSKSVQPTGHISRASIRVKGMAFVPDTITIEAGDRLVVNFQNTGDQRHDLVFANGKSTGSVPVGKSVSVDVGVLGGDTLGWCSLAGHRQMGMEFKVETQGGTVAEQGQSSLGKAASSHVPSPAKLKSQAEKSDPAMAALPPLNDQGKVGTRKYTLEVKERKEQVAAGLERTVWSFDDAGDPRDKGSRPLAQGPVLRGRVGDTFEVTIRNKGSMSHSIDFHAGPAVPQTMMRNIEPGKELMYTFTADRAGIWMYHCSSDPMSNHIANGMYGAVVVDDGTLPPVNAEYVLVQSEIYLGPNGGTADAEKVAAMNPDIMTFNGRAFQYDAHPLKLEKGQRVRIWVLDAGPNQPLSFHIVGTQFEAVWTEGRYLIGAGTGANFAGASSAGAQVLPLLPAQGGFVELKVDQPGDYSIVNHVMSLAEKGAHGILRVS